METPRRSGSADCRPASSEAMKEGPSPQMCRTGPGPFRRKPTQDEALLAPEQTFRKGRRSLTSLVVSGLVSLAPVFHLHRREAVGPAYEDCRLSDCLNAASCMLRRL